MRVAGSDIPKLIADIGGTHARFAVVSDGEPREQIQYRCDDYSDLASLVNAYLAHIAAKHERPSVAALAVAAPMTGDAVTMTNRPWSFSIRALREQLQLQRLIVLNDFTALAMALRDLPTSELEQIGGARPAPGHPLAVLGPGTGLGVSGLIPCGEHWLPLQGEGGHVTLAASDAREAAVLAHLQKQFVHVSAERVVSGAGLALLYETLCALDDVRGEALQPHHVTERALQKSDRHCVEAVDMFCALLGTVASDLALTVGALGGVYIGGGIAPKLGALLAASPFRRRFEAKGRYAAYLAPIPVYVIRSATPALLGLARAFDSPGPRSESHA